MKCTEAISLFNPYLDGSLTGSQMHHLADHFKSCRSCKTEYASLRQTQSLLASLGRQPAPPDLALRIRVAVSQERSASFSRFACLSLIGRDSASSRPKFAFIGWKCRGSASRRYR